MKVIFILGFVLLFFFSTTFQVLITNPIKSIKNAIVDFYFWLRYQKYNLMPTGQLIAYCGLFGKGKTLSAVHHIRKAYKK